jgi:predicted nucleic acid-binding protein
MPGRAFVDTNVLVYAVDAADPRKRTIARRLLEERGADMAISAQVLSEFYVVVTRRLATPMSEKDAAAAVDELSHLPIVVTDADLVRDGIAISREAQLSFWDGLVVAAARAAGCDTLVTEDLAAGSTIAGVDIEDPFAGPP